MTVRCAARSAGDRGGSRIFRPGGPGGSIEPHDEPLDAIDGTGMDLDGSRRLKEDHEAIVLRRRCRSFRYTVLIEKLPRLRADLALDFVIANAENAARGSGMTESICQDLFDAGCDVLTGGNHTFDRSRSSPTSTRTTALAAGKYPPGTPGRGHGVSDRRWSAGIGHQFDLPSVHGRQR